MKFKEDSEMIERMVYLVFDKFKLGTDAWKDDNTITVSDGVIKFKDREVTVSGKKISAFIKKELDSFRKRKKDLEKNKLTEENVVNTPFKTLFNNIEFYNGLDKNYIVFDKMVKRLNDLKIKEILVGQTIDGSISLPDEITLHFSPQINNVPKEQVAGDHSARIKNVLFDKYDVDSASKEEFSCFCHTPHKLTPMEKEKIIDIELDKIKVGRYYPERNIILVYFNPFKIKKIAFSDDDIRPVLKDLFSLFKKMGLKKHDVTKVKQKAFITTFMETARKKLTNISGDLTSSENSIKSYNKEIRLCLKRINDIHTEKQYLEKTIEGDGNVLISELNKTKNLPFITKIKFDNGGVSFIFKPACIKIPRFSRTDHGKNYGSRTFYMGIITANITPGAFSIRCSDPFDRENGKNNPHPHASGQNGDPCFGDGDGANKIYSLLASNKFSELAKMLWFWIKIYINDGAYVKMWTAYDDRVCRGFPVWDEKGKRIKINDPDRIKSKEQVKLEKSSDYKKNIKRFKDTKIT